MNSKDLKKNCFYAIDDTNHMALPNISTIRSLQVLITPDSPFITFTVGNLLFDFMVIPHQYNILKVIDAPVQVQNVNGQINISCDQKVTFDFKIQL